MKIRINNFFYYELYFFSPVYQARSHGLFSILHVYFLLGHCITKTGLSHLCTHDQNGIEDSTPVFPYRIFFDPADIQFPETEPNSIEEFMEQFKVFQ